MEPQDKQGGGAQRTPNADMQAEDAGTERSSADDVGARGNAAGAGDEAGAQDRVRGGQRRGNAR